MEAVWTSPDGVVDSLAAGNGFDPPVPVELGNWTLEVEMTNGTVCTATIEFVEETSPGANFTVVQDGICGGDGIQFDLTTVDPNLEYAWNFGDGSGNPGSTLAQPVHEFYFDGGGTQDANVSLTVTDPNTGCSTTTTQSITVLQMPNPGLGNLQPLCVSDADYPYYEITSTLSPSPGLPADDGIANWSIDWGNGSDTTFTEYTPAILGGYIGSTYNDYGYYTVTVEVTGDNGCITNVADSLFVGNNPLIGSANPGNTTGICSPYMLTFPISNFAGNADGTTYLIDFGDGTTQTFIHDNDLPNAPPSAVTHEYNSGTCGGTTQSGLFDNAITFTIIATNECESSSASVEPIRIHTAPEPIINGPDGVCVNGTWNYSVTGNGEVVTSSGCSNAPASWVITPQDGQPNPTPYFGFDSIWSTTYPAPGEYLITTESDHPNCGLAQANMTVCVYPDIQAVGQVTPLGSCAPLPVTLADLTPDPPLCGSPSTTWTISGPGGYTYTAGSATEANATVELQAPGTYTIELRVGIPGKDACPASTLAWTVDVLDTPPANIAVDPVACEGENVEVQDLTAATTLTPVQTWTWTLDGNIEGTSSGDLTLSNLPQGTYTITGTATNACGTASDSETFSVEAAPDINFTLSAPSACAGTNVTVNATGTGNPNFQWTGNPNINGGLSGSSVVVNATANTTVEVTATGANGCTSSDDVEVEFTPLPVASAAVPAAPCPGASVTLTASASGGTPPYASFDWTGDLTETGQTDISWTAPPSATPLNLTLTVTDAEGCTDDIPVNLSSLNNPVVEAGGPLNLCDNGSYTTPLTDFSPGLTAGGMGVWTGTGLTGTSDFTSSGAGTYALTYTFTDNAGCVGSDDLLVNVEPFVQVDPGLPTEACQNDAPFVVPGFSPATASWSGIGVATDGTVDPGLPPNTYTLTLVNGVGSCESTATSSFTVHPAPDSGDFRTNSSMPGRRIQCHPQRALGTRCFLGG